MVDASFCSRWSLLLIVVFGSLATAEEPDPWRIAPPVVRQVSAIDQEARADLIGLILKHRDDDFREHWAVDIPPRASGVPQDYTVLVYGDEGGYPRSAQRIEVRVKDGRAKIELCDADGIFRLERPAQEIDRLVRQLAYAFHATDRVVKAGSKFGFRSVSHARRPTIEVYSNDKHAPCHLVTPAWQAIASEVSRSTNGLRGFMHTRLSDTLNTLTRQEGELIAADDENREVLMRLGVVPPVNSDEADYLRGDLPATEASIYGELAIKRRLASARGDLKRLGRDDLAMQLEVSTEFDPGPRIQAAVLQYQTDHHFGHWALEFAKDEQHPERLQSLLELLPFDLNHYHVESILDCAATRQLFSGQIELIKSFYRQTCDQDAKISAANALLRLTHEEEYFVYLDELVRVLPRGPKDDYRHPRRVAAQHLLGYASETGKYREQGYALLKLLIGELENIDKPDWGELRTCVRALGALGSPADLPFLTRIAKGETAYGDAIRAMTTIDRQAGLTALHSRIEKLNRGDVDTARYGNEVFTNFNLIAMQRDTAAVPLLQEAWQKLLQSNPKRDWVWDQYDPAPVVAFLQAKTISERVDAAFRFFPNRNLPDAWVESYVNQLIADGGDPDRCKQLLNLGWNHRPPRGR